MSPLTLHLLMLALCLAGLACLALAMERHQQDVFRRALAAAPGRCLRLFGWVLLLAALGAGVSARGWGLGLVALSGHASLAAGLVFTALVVHGRTRAWRGSMPGK